MSSVKIDQAISEKVTVYENISQDVLVIGIDRVKLILIEHNRLVRNSTDWIGPVGVFITVLANLLTANFTENRFGISPQTWQGIFLLVCIGSGIWSLVVIINSLISRSKASVDACISSLKAEAANK